MKNNVEIYTMALVRVIQESEEYQAFERIKKKSTRYFNFYYNIRGNSNSTKAKATHSSKEF